MNTNIIPERMKFTISPMMLQFAMSWIKQPIAVFYKTRLLNNKQLVQCLPFNYESNVRRLGPLYFEQCVCVIVYRIIFYNFGCFCYLIYNTYVIVGITTIPFFPHKSSCMICKEGQRKEREEGKNAWKTEKQREFTKDTL